MLPHEVFLDTAFALALANPKDLLHQRAIQLADQLDAERTRLVTTRAVLLEIGNVLVLDHTGFLSILSSTKSYVEGRKMPSASSRDIFGCSKNRQNRIVENSTYPLDDFGFR